jgi:hypothetical protein
MNQLFVVKEIITGNEQLIKKINIITSFYKSRLDQQKDDIRNKELEESLYHNINSTLVEKIHLFVDDDEALQSLNNIITLTSTDKINVISVGKKPAYSDLFAYAQNNLQNKICMVTNSDIFIHEYDTRVINKLSSNNNLCYSLTRYEQDLTCPLINNYCGSHDCFIFNSPINNLNIDKISHVQYNWGSENIVIYEIKNCCLEVFNPCYQIKIVHLHSSELREYSRKALYDGRIGLAKPETL